jgi:predicted phage terminase large subunit-like protein
MSKFTVEELGSELLKRRAARDGLIPFIEYTKPNYETAKHHRLIAGYLEAVSRGEITRLIINTPPRHGKSELVTRRFPAWYLGKFPDKFVISASYNADFATDFGRDVRGIISTPECQTVFPGLRLAQDSRAADRWNTDKGGAYFAAGVGSGITGRGMHLGIVDDPVKDEEEANSPQILEKIWRWYKTAFKTRMMPNAAQVISMTRWAKADLVGRILEDESSKWTVINLPAMAGEDDVLGRVEGDPLWPEWYNREALMDMYDTLTLKEWASLYQGVPIPEGGHIFKTEWWKYYRELPPVECVIQSWDTAFEENEQNSYSVCTTWGVTPYSFALLNVFRKKMQYDELEEQVNVMGNRFRPIAICIEKKASGIVLVQRLEKISRYPIIPVQVIKDKISRARMVTPLFRSGRVELPELAPWVDTYKEEMEGFPGTKFDDQVDSTSNALTYLQENFVFTSAVPPIEVEMDWDPYNYREPKVERHWDIYNRRIH